MIKDTSKQMAKVAVAALKEKKGCKGNRYK